MEIPQEGFAANQHSSPTPFDKKTYHTALIHQVEVNLEGHIGTQDSESPLGHGLDLSGVLPIPAIFKLKKIWAA